MVFRLPVLILIPCLLLASCAPRMQPQPPVPSAELQAALTGPLCKRLDGIEWPCSDTDGRLWNEWYNQQTDYRHQQHRQDTSGPTAGQVAAGVAGAVLVVGTLGVLAALSRHSSYSSHSYDTITTRCFYGKYRSSCTTRY